MPQILVVDISAFNIHADTNTLSCQVWFSFKSLHFGFIQPNVVSPGTSFRRKAFKQKHIACSLHHCFLHSASNRFSYRKNIKTVFKKEFTKEQIAGGRNGRIGERNTTTFLNSEKTVTQFVYRCTYRHTTSRTHNL